MKHLKACVALSIVAALAGCTSRISSGQLDFDNGVAYKHGSNTPYSGIADFDTMPDFARDIDFDTNLDGHSYLNKGAIDHCAVSFKAGAVEGNTACYHRDGQKALLFTLHRGRLDGEAIRYNQDGDAIFDTSWRDGALAGKQRIYSPDGKYLIHAWTVRDGHKRGEEVRHTDNGDDLADGTWSDEGKFTGSLLYTKSNTVFTLKDGVKDGAFRAFTDPGYDKVLVEGNYEKGLPSGKWTFYGQNTFSTYMKNNLNVADPGYDGASHALTNLDAIRTLEVHWEAGHLEGRMRGYDQDKNQILAYDMKDGQITAPVERYDPSSDKKFVITNPAIIAALNYTKPASEANQWGPPLYDQSYMLRHPQEKAALLRQQEAKRQAETLRDQEIAYVLDPVHHPLPAPAPSAPMPSGDPAHLSGTAQLVSGDSTLAVPASTAPSAAAQDATQQAASSASAGSMEDESDYPPMTPCIQHWEDAYQAERDAQGLDSTVSIDQAWEWKHWCDAGRQAPTPQQAVKSDQWKNSGQH